MDASLLHQKAVTMVSQGRHREAAPIVADLVKHFPREAAFWHLYSLIALALKQAARAIEFSKKAIDLLDAKASAAAGEYRAQLANAHLHVLDIAQALKIADDCRRDCENNPIALDTLGRVYTGCGELHKAREVFEAAAALVPDSMHYQFNLATALRGLGELEAAETIYDKVIERHPEDFEAYANRSQLRKQTEERNHIDELAGLLQNHFENWRDEVQLCFALAKECEDVGRYEQSFKALKRGADIRRGHTHYQVEGDLEAISNIVQTFSETVINRQQDTCFSDEPIFVLGLPRTGTTLVERILGSHSCVTSAGELQNFAAEMVKQVRRASPAETLDKVKMIKRSVAVDFRQLGHDYIESTRPLTGSKPHFIDKLPLNYLYMGLIAMALPNAKIIHLTRHPMDACYAIYKTLFQDAYPFSYNLEDLGRYYIAYHHMMAHWRKVMPGKFLDVSYEQLVADQENQTRRLLEYCDLPWEDACLEFHRNTQASMTASAAQIRQPIYNSSVEKWRRYETQLEPLRVLLENAGILL
ncbi:tetratricopeptide repeat protein [Pseudomaricurvus alkylphenolicus]|uniref:tetratricopeptide repeat-containing sulfotransferase family protein n=1 Tax=Pseudomaricurvus alkylphenolicus TaxID=1306991 RepID=UPI0014232607|nr:tetratricopeptide repeat-containing sulfotransferase family protein [Pseudomaricurvus alkylphenolicus]NIB38307.1 tetratricopeptide repeat protein [Pseudomaricurvus alkylphenolicus]